MVKAKKSAKRTSKKSSKKSKPAHEKHAVYVGLAVIVAVVFSFIFIFASDAGSGDEALAGNAIEVSKDFSDYQRAKARFSEVCVERCSGAEQCSNICVSKSFAQYYDKQAAGFIIPGVLNAEGKDLGAQKSISGDDTTIEGDPEGSTDYDKGSNQETAEESEDTEDSEK